MRIAVTIFLTDETITPVRLARELERRGFAGVYLPEHTHIPVDRTTPYPAGGELPREYGRTLDPFVALGQAAAVTERLGLGTGITLVAQHDPIDLAKQAATLDHLSGGRLTLGLGYGWNVEEAADHGVEWRTRRELVRDRMGLMRALWAEEPMAYEGSSGAFGPASRTRSRCGSRAGRWPDRAPWSAGRRDRSCSRTSASTPTAGCRSAGAGSPRRCRYCGRPGPTRAASPAPSRSCRTPCVPARKAGALRGAGRRGGRGAAPVGGEAGVLRALDEVQPFVAADGA
ncbi:hypothetical protein SHKM778_88010 [Streptomyces sp. KM77-8]|uniref:Luciferase-like domain-containing protein n=1 Tax=Streptomyces haneummycinicus TaxID=3074435 RepID=A0AAT9HXI1_9ACTN